VTVVVTDHAVLRYLERIAGADIEGLRRSLARELVRSQAAVADAGLPSRHIVRTFEADYVVDRGVVLTVLPPRAGPYEVLREAARIAEAIRHRERGR
jgi:hypothetical protein